MKLILAIISNDDSSSIIPKLNENGYFVTMLSTTGGFLRVGNTTLLIVTEDEKVDEVKKLFSTYCSSRKKVNPTTESFGKGLNPQSLPEKINVGGAAFFVLDVDRLEKF